MGRPAAYGTEQILDTAATLIGEGGPAALSVARIADRLGAPSGSIYHRFRSRDILAASLWLRAVERFQDGWLDAVRHDDPRGAARMAAMHVLSWSRDHLDDARLLLLYRSDDLLNQGWPPELTQRNHQQRARIDKAIGALCDRLGAATAAERRRVIFAVIDIPYGAVRRPLAAGKRPPRELDAFVDDAVVAVIEGIGRP